MIGCTLAAWMSAAAPMVSKVILRAYRAHRLRQGLQIRRASQEKKKIRLDYVENWPAPGSEDTELGVLMEPEVGHGETKVYAGVQA
jgi:hypothetical protein